MSGAADSSGAGAAAAGEDDQQTVMTELTMWQRGCAAGVASFLSSLALNPMDVVKTRMQTQSTAAMLPKAAAAGSEGVMALRYSPGTMGLTSGLFHGGGDANGGMFTGNSPVLRVPPQQPSQLAARYRSMFGGMYQIARAEGLQTLWRGTDAAIFMTVPLVAIYLPLYDHLLDEFSAAGPYAPLAAGATSRAVAGFATAPLELARVRMQAEQQSANGGAARRGGIFKQLSGSPGTSAFRRVTSLWTGMGASLAKDVPFAALYWSMLEPMRGWLMRHDYQVAALHWSLPEPMRWRLMRHDYQTMAEQLWQNANINEVPVVGDMSEVDGLPLERMHPLSASEILGINIAAAGAAASLAAIVTTPFDVVKTKQQTAPAGKSSSIAQCLAKVYKSGGVRGLFAGGGPRTARTAAGYAIVTSLFEVFKSFARQSQGGTLADK